MRTIRWACLGVLCVSASLAAQQGYTRVLLYDLSNFYYREPRQPVAPEARRLSNTSIPAKVRSLDGQKVVVDGFVFPYDQSATRVTEFMLVADEDECAFGDGPTTMNSWIDVRMKPGTFAKWEPGQAVVRGVFSVGEQFDKDGYVVSLFRMTADSVN